MCPLHVTPRFCLMTEMKARLRDPILALLLIVAFAVGGQVYDGNFHTVHEGEVYRSAQLSAEQLAERIDAHGVRSILNLRGSDAGEAWYEQERATAEARGVVHVDFGFSAYRPLDNADMTRLVALMAELPKPLLVHCWGGADRTGLASALYLYGVKARPANDAARQLSVRYGHVPWLFWADARAMDDSFQGYVSGEK